MTTKRKLFWVILAVLMACVGLGISWSIEEDLKPLPYEKYRVFDGVSLSNTFMEVNSERPFVARRWLGKTASESDIKALLDKYRRMVTKEPQFKNDLYEESIVFMLTTKQRGDQYRFFKTPEQTWMNLRGREGVALVRDGKAIAGIITLATYSSKE